MKHAGKKAYFLNKKTVIKQLFSIVHLRKDCEQLLTLQQLIQAFGTK